MMRKEGLIMGIRFRKSFNSGPLRVNFSKTGIGCSVGVPGFRYTITADGRERVTFSIPGTGLSYVEESSAARRHNNELEQAIARGDYEEIHNGNIENFTSPEYKAFIDECQAWLLAWQTAKKMIIGSCIAMFLIVLMGAFAINTVLGIVLEMIPVAVILYACCMFYTLKHNKVDVQYSFDVTPNPYTDLQELIDNTVKSSAMWSTKSIIHNIKSRANAGATQTVDLKKSTLTVKQPQFLTTNIKCYCLDLPNEDLYILPDKVIFVRKDKVGAVDVSSIKITCTYSDFRWYDTVPSDTVVTGYSWQYVNNNGSPDKRYKDNRQIPICKFGYMEVTSPEGINIILYTSNYEKSLAFYNKWCVITNNQRNRRYDDIVKKAEKVVDDVKKFVEDEVIEDEVIGDVDHIDDSVVDEPTDDYFSYSGNAYVLNTDYKNEPQHHEFMISNGVAAAYGSGYKEKIDRLEERDLVLLYQSGIGLVAFGLVTRNKFQNEAEEMIAVQLEDYHVLKEPMAAATIKKLLDFNMPFVQTIFPVRVEHVEILIPVLMKDYVEARTE